MSNNQQQEIKYLFNIAADGSITPRPAMKGTAVPELPPGVYTLDYTPPGPMSSMSVSLRPEANFTLPKRIYGNVNGNVDRFIKSYEMNEKNLGVLLVGEQGSGKTITLKSLAVKCTEMGYPVILVDTLIPGPVLNWVLSTITQPAMVAFDEYEKTYKDMDEQAAILKLLDGTTTASKKMVCLTANSLSKVSPHMLSRPSRVRYLLQFKRLELATVIDYVQANLKDCTEAHLHAFVHMALADAGGGSAGESNGMNFDSMAEYVREMNQFGGTLDETLNIMGRYGQDSWAHFEVFGFVNGERLYHAKAHGIHKSAYLDATGTQITFSIHVTKLREKKVPEEADAFDWSHDLVTLTGEDFKGFGDSHDTALFEKEGVEYHLRYIDNEAASTLRDKVAKEESGKSRGGVETFEFLHRTSGKHRNLIQTPPVLVPLNSSSQPSPSNPLVEVFEISATPGQPSTSESMNQVLSDPNTTVTTASQLGTTAEPCPTSFNEKMDRLIGERKEIKGVILKDSYHITRGTQNKE